MVHKENVTLTQSSLCIKAVCCDILGLWHKGRGAQQANDTGLCGIQRVCYTNGGPPGCILLSWKLKEHKVWDDSFVLKPEHCVESFIIKHKTTPQLCWIFCLETLSSTKSTQNLSFWNPKWQLSWILHLKTWNSTVSKQNPSSWNLKWLLSWILHLQIWNSTVSKQNSSS